MAFCSSFIAAPGASSAVSAGKTLTARAAPRPPFVLAPVLARPFAGQASADKDPLPAPPRSYAPYDSAAETAAADITEVEWDPASANTGGCAAQE